MNARNDSPEASLYKRIDGYDAIAAVIDDLPYERHDYLYTVDELEPWVDRVKAVAAKSEGHLRRHEKSLHR